VGLLLVGLASLSSLAFLNRSMGVGFGPLVLFLGLGHAVLGYRLIRWNATTRPPPPHVEPALPPGEPSPRVDSEKGA
jgi:hypothetical protein